MVNRVMRIALLVGTACGPAMVPGLAYAQEAGDGRASSGRLEEIIVTAQKQAENLQVVPVAVTALSKQALEDARVTNVRDLSALAPGLIVNGQSGSANLPAMQMRGITTGSTGLTVDAGITMYINNVYLGRANGSLFDLAEIERIEVLRGPQGTLFGRNSTGGAINILTKGPRGELAAKLDVSISNYAGRRLRARIDTPEWQGLSASLTYLHDEERGSVRNLTPGVAWDFTRRSNGHVGKIVSAKTLGMQNVDAVEAAVRFDNGGPLKLDYRFDYTDRKATQPGVQVLAFSEGSGGAAAKAIYAAQPALGGMNLVSTKRLGALANDMMSVNTLEVFGHSLTASLALSDTVEIKNIAAWRGFDEDVGGNDIGGGNALRDPSGSGQPYKILATVGGSPQKQRQFTNEFQITAKTRLLDIVAGAFYFVENADGIPSLFNQFSFTAIPNFDPAPRAVPYMATVARNRSIAAFMQGTLHITDRLDVTAGARITKDSRYYRDVTSAFPAGLAVKRKFKHTDWLATVTYRPTDNVMAYGKVSTGYIAGGIRSAIPFEPEELTSYEVGIKADLLDKRLRVNAAAYVSQYKNLQVTLFEKGVTFIENAGKANIKGLELEVTAAPTSYLTFGGNLAFTDFKYKEYIQVVGGVRKDVADSLIPTSRPRWTSQVFGQLSVPIENVGTASFRLDGTYRSTTRLTAKEAYASAALNDLVTLDAFWQVNARASLSDIDLGGAKAQVSFFVRNITDKKNLEFAADVGSVIVGFFRQPRTYGLDMTIEF
ncbi:TonB-dependent receptor [Caenibius tardaugens]|nr:TonB-dependent receptor [Caenibius tardaugens]